MHVICSTLDGYTGRIGHKLYWSVSPISYRKENIYRVTKIFGCSIIGFIFILLVIIISIPIALLGTFSVRWYIVSGAPPEKSTFKLEFDHNMDVTQPWRYGANFDETSEGLTSLTQRQKKSVFSSSAVPIIMSLDEFNKREDHDNKYKVYTKNEAKVAHNISDRRRVRYFAPFGSLLGFADDYQDDEYDMGEYETKEKSSTVSGAPTCDQQRSVKDEVEIIVAKETEQRTTERHSLAVKALVAELAEKKSKRDYLQWKRNQQLTAVSKFMASYGLSNDRSPTSGVASLLKGTFVFPPDAAFDIHLNLIDVDVFTIVRDSSVTSTVTGEEAGKPSPLTLASSRVVNKAFDFIRDPEDQSQGCAADGLCPLQTTPSSLQTPISLSMTLVSDLIADTYRDSHVSNEHPKHGNTVIAQSVASAVADISWESVKIQKRQRLRRQRRRQHTHAGSESDQQLLLSDSNGFLEAIFVYPIKALFFFIERQIQWIISSIIYILRELFRIFVLNPVNFGIDLFLFWVDVVKETILWLVVGWIRVGIKISSSVLRFIFDVPSVSDYLHNNTFPGYFLSTLIKLINSVAYSVTGGTNSKEGTPRLVQGLVQNDINFLVATNFIARDQKSAFQAFEFTLFTRPTLETPITKNQNNQEDRQFAVIIREATLHLHAKYTGLQWFFINYPIVSFIVVLVWLTTIVGSICSLVALFIYSFILNLLFINNIQSD